MAEEILASVQVRRDSKANWESVNPILLNGEAAYEQDTDMFKIGDGVKRYSDLPYHNKVGPQGEPGPTPQISMNVSTGNPGTSASVSVTGTAENPVINLTVPRGDTGKTGSTGPKGDTGSSGVYIGTSQPTDSNINVWIDSDGEPTEVIDDFAREEIGRLKSEIPTTLPNPQPITINGQRYDGSDAVTVTTAEIDDTLTQSGQVADAKAVGDRLNELKGDLGELKDLRNITLLDGATENEKSAYNNFLYILQEGDIGVDLSEYRVATIYNTESIPKRIILKISETKQIIIDMTSNHYSIKLGNGYIHVGYNWDKHTTNVNKNASNSYLKIAESIRAFERFNSALSEVDSHVTELSDNVDYLIEAVKDVQIQSAGNEVSNRVSQNGYIDIKQPYYHYNTIVNFGVYIYPVTKGNYYNISCEKYALGGNYIGAIFTTTDITGKTENAILNDAKMIFEATTTPTDVNYSYYAQKDGYIITAWNASKSSYAIVRNVVIVKNQEKINQIESNIKRTESFTNPLSNKTLAVLGDSIMMLMRTNFGSGTNVVSYLGSDGNTYEYSDLTNINGKLYLTADTSVSVTIVNSKQTELDAQNWDALKDRLGLKNLINLGLGGATVEEKDIITSYPYADGDNKTTCISNEVRMLDRLVQNGANIPDCIMIWAGTNGGSSVDLSNYEEIMALDWDTLSDDTLGRSYRKTFYGGLRYTLESLYRSYKNATIILFTPKQTNPSNYRTYELMSQKADAIKKIGGRYSCIVVDALNEIGIVDLFEASDGSGYWESDGLHLKAEGKILYSNYTAKRLANLYFSKTDN